MRLRNILFVSLLCASSSTVSAQNDNEVVRVKYNYSTEPETFPRSSISSIDFSYSQMYNEENLAEQLRNNPDSVMALLYPNESTAFISELMSDNMADYNAANTKDMRLDSYFPADDFIFSYRSTPANAYYSLKADSPLSVWNTYCDAIHRCNLVLQNTSDRALQGEAYLCRAWLHFQLATVFSPIWRDDVVSAQEMGLPYMKNLEHGQKIEDSRLSVAEFYNQLELDLLQGIAMVGDAGTVYRFNLRSANAFATRFYLMKREWNKVVQYANAALGDGAPELRDWTAFENCMYLNDYVKIWFDDSKTNLMLQDTYSLRSRRFGYRYGALGEAAVGLGFDASRNHTELIPGHTGYICLVSCVNGGGAFSSSDLGMYISAKQWEVFEYTDVEQGVGYVHNFYIPFSVGETLFARAEARLYLGDWAGCLEDLNLWTQNADERTLDLKKLHSWCEKNRDYFHLPLRPTDVSSSFTMPQTTFTDSEGTTITFEELQECLIHMRRMDTYSQDCRLFDLKRYGMPVVHNTLEPQSGARNSYVMSYDNSSDNHYYLPLPTAHIVLGTPSYNIQFNDGTNLEINNNSVEHIDFSADLDADKQFETSIEELNAKATQGWVMQSFNSTRGWFTMVENISVPADGVFTIDGWEMTVDGHFGDTWTCHSDDYYSHTEYRIFPCPETGKEAYDHAALNQAYNAFAVPYYIIKKDGQIIDKLTVTRRKIQTDFTDAYYYKYQDAILREDGSVFVVAYTPEGFRVKTGILPEDCSLEFVGDEQDITFTSTDGHYTIEPDLLLLSMTKSTTLNINAPNEELSSLLSSVGYRYTTPILDLQKQQIVLKYRNNRSQTASIYYNVQINTVENGLHVDIDWNNYLVGSPIQNDELQNAINNWLAQFVGDYTINANITLQEISNESVDYESGETYYETTDYWGNGFPMNLRKAGISGSFDKSDNSEVRLTF